MEETPVNVEQQLLHELGIKLGYPALPEEQARKYDGLKFEVK